MIKDRSKSMLLAVRLNRGVNTCVLAMSWLCFCMFWPCSGQICSRQLAMFWPCSGYVLAMFWPYGGVLAMFWPYGGVLAMFWQYGGV